MNTKIRFLLALALFAAIVIAGIGAPAWADKLNIGAEAPAGVNPSAPGGIRPEGTVKTGKKQVTVPPAGGLATIGSCATVGAGTTAPGVSYTASVVSDTDLPIPFPGTLQGCGVKVEAKPTGTTLVDAITFCFPVGPSGKTGSAYYWDGTKWVPTSTATSGGKSCVTIPAGAPSPTYAGLFAP